MRVALIVMVVLIVAGFALSRITLNTYAISPGGAQPVAPLITIDGHKAPASSGKILLTDVYLTPLTAWNYLGFWLDSNAQIIPADSLVDPGIPPSELNAQGYLEMAQSKDAARFVALTHLGYLVGQTNDGAIVGAIAKSAPAYGIVNVADVIVGVDGTAVATSCDVISSLHAASPGRTIALRVKPATIHGDGTITYGSPVIRKVTAVAPPSGTETSDPQCPGVSGPNPVYLGVSLTTDVAYRFPFPVSISTPNIGGPSAGLAMTLGIMDQLSHGSLVHHRTLAATGTMSPDGSVGDVGGVPQKAVAVSRAGATLFLVPAVELGPARSKASSSVRVVAVNTIDQALKVLEGLGGTLEMAHPSK